jgi:hypothetical protein
MQGVLVALECGGACLLVRAVRCYLADLRCTACWETVMVTVPQPRIYRILPARSCIQATMDFEQTPS